jgi:hypothetical protein
MREILEIEREIERLPGEEWQRVWKQMLSRMNGLTGMRSLPFWKVHEGRLPQAFRERPDQDRLI